MVISITLKALIKQKTFSDRNLCKILFNPLDNEKKGVNFAPRIINIKN